MRESLHIIYQCIIKLQNLKYSEDNSFIVNDNKIVPPSRAFMKYSMESLIHHLSFIQKELLFIRRNLYCS
jgi:NADH:ubiquinone oxidoreductase subunit D